MRATATVFALLFAVGTIAAQETSETETPQQPDFSREGLQRVFDVQAQERPEREPPVRFTVGGVEFRALGTRWRIAYLPIMAPFVGARLRTTSEWPDAFALTGMQVATSPRAWRTQRAISRELRAIERRARIAVDAD